MVPHGLTCSKSRRVCVWPRGPISRSRRRHVCTKGPGWGCAAGGAWDPLGSASAGSSSPSPHGPSWEAGGEPGGAAVGRSSPRRLPRDVTREDIGMWVLSPGASPSAGSGIGECGVRGEGGLSGCLTRHAAGSGGHGRPVAAAGVSAERSTRPCHAEHQRSSPSGTGGSVHTWVCTCVFPGGSCSKCTDTGGRADGGAPSGAL